MQRKLSTRYSFGWEVWDAPLISKWTPNATIASLPWVTAFCRAWGAPAFNGTSSIYLRGSPHTWIMHSESMCVCDPFYLANGVNDKISSSDSSSSESVSTNSFVIPSWWDVLNFWPPHLAVCETGGGIGGTLIDKAEPNWREDRTLPSRWGCCEWLVPLRELA